MILPAESHLAFGRVKTHALHCPDQGFGFAVGLGGGQGGGDGHGCRKPACRKKIGRGIEFGLVAFDHFIIQRVFGDAVIVIGRPFHAGEIFVHRHGRQNIAAGGNVNAVTLEIQVGDLEGIAGTRP